MFMEVIGKRLLILEKNIKVISGRVIKETKLQGHKTKLTIMEIGGGFTSQVTVPDRLIEIGETQYRGIEYKIY